MSEPLLIGVAGLGTVGGATVRLLEEHAELLARRAGRELRVLAVSARDPDKDRGFPLDPYVWYDEARELASDPRLDVVVELIGGAEGIAREVIGTAIARGKRVVTGNKALIALHGGELTKLATETGASLHYEAAVAGGIPIIKALREGLSGNDVNQVYGILNGTCNYILSSMEETGCEFDEALARAQEIGYAEADPGTDIDGEDAAHKLAILTALAFGAEIDFSKVYIEGIRHVRLEDIRLARELGFRIKHLGIARRTALGIEQRVYPAMIRNTSPVAPVDGATNAVVADGDYVGRTVYEGQGAGAEPSASAVVADLVDIARGLDLPVFGMDADELTPIRDIPVTERQGEYYIRIQVLDRPGVMADVTAIFRDLGVSLESIIQRGRAEDHNGTVPVVMVTHVASEARVTEAIERIGAIEVVVEPPVMIRIEDL